MQGILEINSFAEYKKEFFYTCLTDFQLWTMYRMMKRKRFEKASS